MGTILTLDLIGGTKSDPNRQISNKVEFVSRGGYSDLMFMQFSIPAAATFLKFHIATRYRGTNPALGNVNVGIQPAQGPSFFRIVQGTFRGTLALSLASVQGQVVPWLGIGFPAGAFGIKEFTAIISDLRIVDDATVPSGQLQDVCNAGLSRRSTIRPRAKRAKKK